MNTVNFVTIPASIVPDQEIVVFGDRRLTYAQLNDMVGALLRGSSSNWASEPWRRRRQRSIPTPTSTSPATMRPPRPA